MLDKDKKNNLNSQADPSVKADEGGNAVASKSVYLEKKKIDRNKRRPASRNEIKDEYEQKIVDIARVTRVMAGGKRMRFRACVAIGN